MLTSGKLSEHVKRDIALTHVSLASTAGTGEYFPMTGFKKACFYFDAPAMAKTKTIIAQVMEAKTAAAGSAAALTGATATITANTKVSKGLLTANTIVDATSTVTLTATMADGSTSVQVYICEDTTPVEADGEFDSGSTDTTACTNLAAVINALQGDYILATPSTTTVILTAKKPGDAVITISGEDSTIVASTLAAAGYVEIDASQMTALFTHVALKLTTDATIVTGGSLARAGNTRGKQSPGQLVAAAKVL